MSIFRHFFLYVLAASLSFGQARREFEVASIRPTAERPETVDVGLHIDGSQVRCVYFSLKDYIGMAFQVKAYQISGPEWLAS